MINAQFMENNFVGNAEFLKMHQIVNSQIFRDVLNHYSDYFDDIIFAIPDNRNYQIFQKNLL